MREHVFCVLNISNGNGCMDDRSTIALLLVGHDSLEHADNQFIVYRDDGLMGERQSTKGRVQFEEESIIIQSEMARKPPRNADAMISMRNKRRKHQYSSSTTQFDDGKKNPNDRITAHSCHQRPDALSSQSQFLTAGISIQHSNVPYTKRHHYPKAIRTDCMYDDELGW